MPFSLYLKSLLTAFVEVYEQYFSKTIIRALLWTIICFAVSQVLATYCSYDPAMQIQPVSILSFFVLRFSYHNTYSYADLTKTVFIFCVSVFSISLIRKIKVKDVLALLGTMAFCALLDIALFRLRGQLERPVINRHLLIWIDAIIFFLRIYLPLLLFAVTLQLCLVQPNFTVKKIIYLFIALWLFNEISYELMMLVRADFFGLLMSPVKDPSYRYVMESVLGVPLVAAFFAGYYCAMTKPFDLMAKKQ